MDYDTTVAIKRIVAVPGDALLLGNGGMVLSADARATGFEQHACDAIGDIEDAVVVGDAGYAVGGPNLANKSTRAS